MFKISSKNSNSLARAGTIKTSHGDINTPFYMPVATKGAIKYVDSKESEALGTQCIISNALINSFKPGIDVIKKFGGLHSFVQKKDS